MKRAGPPGAVTKRVVAAAENRHPGRVERRELRAGCAGLIPATDTFDFQVRIFERMRAGDEEAAERIYRELLPAIVFVMQSLDTLICYGKRIAAWRLGLQVVHDRAPALAPTSFGLACARRYAAALGSLP